MQTSRATCYLALPRAHARGFGSIRCMHMRTLMHLDDISTLAHHDQRLTMHCCKADKREALDRVRQSAGSVNASIELGMGTSRIAAGRSVRVSNAPSITIARHVAWALCGGVAYTVVPQLARDLGAAPAAEEESAACARATPAPMHAQRSLGLVWCA